MVNLLTIQPSKNFGPIPLTSCIFLSWGLAPSDMVGSEGLDRADPPLSASIIISVLLDHGEFNCNKMIPKMKLKKEPGFLWNTYFYNIHLYHISYSMEDI